MNKPATSNRSGGPQTASGKAIASRNALKTGIASSRWINESEQDRYDDLIAQLTTEYRPKGSTLSILIEHLAMVVVKIERLQRIENAHFEKARVISEHVASQRPANSPSSYLPDTPDGQALALRISSDAAMPDIDRLNTLARYLVSLSRERSKLIAEILHLRDEQVRRESISAQPRAPRLAGTGVITEISDVGTVSTRRSSDER
jgi:hypothetical protein